MPTLGEELRQKREQRRITLAEIAEATRIGTRFLKAIETDNFSILPGGIFTRSFIRAYAKYVGMNEEEAIGLYLQQVAGPSAEQQELQDQSSAATVAPAEKPKKQTATVVNRPTPVHEQARRFEPVAYRQSRPRTNWPTIVIGAGILIFIVLIVLALVKQFNQRSGESGSQAAVEQKTSPAKPSSSSPPRPDTSPRSEQTSPGISQLAPGQPLVVKLEAATGESWVKYQVDDAKPITLILKQGESQDLPSAQRQVTLNCGNRLTLKLKINNRDANFPADTPKFKSKVVISRDNLQTFFQ